MPDARISRPDNPKNKTVSLLMIPISYRRLIHMLLNDSKLNNSTRRRVKLSNQ